MKLSTHGRSSSVVHADPESGVVFRINRVEFLCSAALLGWLDEVNCQSIRHVLTESQNTLIQSIMQFRRQASLFDGGSFDDFTYLSCDQHWYTVVNSHNQHVSRRLFFHARQDISSTLPSDGTDMDMQEHLDTPTAPDAGVTPMWADDVPGQQQQAHHPAISAPIEQQQHTHPRASAGGSGGVRADRPRSSPAGAQKPVPEWAVPGHSSWGFRKTSGLGPEYVRFEDRTTILIGRSPSADVVLPDTVQSPETSREHVLLASRRLWPESHGPRSQVIYIQDQNSTWGTFVNGKRLAAGEWITLTIGDRVTLGRVGSAADASVTYVLSRDPLLRLSPEERAVQEAIARFAKLDMAVADKNARQ
jgi:hypothetical protein